MNKETEIGYKVIKEYADKIRKNEIQTIINLAQMKIINDLRDKLDELDKKIKNGGK